MRYMLLVKATARSEAGEMPTEQELTEMTRYNEELVRAGVLVAGEGLHPSSRAARVDFAGGTPTVTAGPFARTEELVSGFWILEVGSREEALEWARRVPFQEGQVELRKIFEPADFGDAFTPELQDAEARMRADIAERHG